MRINQIILILFFLSNLIYSQNIRQLFPDFYQDGKRLLSGASGGLRNPQFSSADLNGDGVKDIIIFDKTGNKVMCFINQSSGTDISFKYTTEYDSQFPDLHTWAFFQDFNKDGIIDIFTAADMAIPGIAVYRGSINNGKFSFNKMRLPFNGAMAEPIPGTNQLTNLYHAITDIPAIIDVDFDGDTDVLTFDTEGSKIVWYDNLSKEKGFGLDTFIMFARDRCFGRFYESFTSSDLFLSTDGISCARSFTSEGETPRHSGSTILAFDEGCDKDLDLVIGDISNDNIIFLRNSKKDTLNVMTFQDSNYPSQNTPYSSPVFNAAYMLDVNNDGLKDLIITPSELDVGMNDYHIWLYLNEGSNCTPSFKLYTKRFLIDNIVSIGAKSSIAAIDINGDKLLDILMTGSGKDGEDKKRLNRIYYYKNIGTPKSPEFILEDSDYLKFSSILAFTNSITLATGDLEGDGDSDLLLGENNGRIYIYENKAGANKPCKFEGFSYPAFDISVGQQAKPTLFDINGDGLNDILIGEQNPKISYFQNNGVQGQSYSFNSSPTIANYGAALKGSLNFADWNNSPKFVKEHGGQIFALIGFENGRVSRYKLKKGNVDSLLLESYRLGNINVGRKATVEVADINDDGFYDLLVGNFRGGITIYSTDIKSKETVNVVETHNERLRVFPNPTNNMIFWEGEVGYYEIINVLGKSVLTGKAHDSSSINISSFDSGVFIIRFFDNNNKLISVNKIIKL